MKKVVFVHRVTCDYSHSFLVKLHATLEANGIAFFVASGSPWKHEGLVDVLEKLPFGVRCENRSVGPRIFFARGALKAAEDADLVILEQLSASMHLYAFVCWRWLGILKSLFVKGSHRRKLAFYGHGATLNAPKRRLITDSWKEFFAKQVDWWFTYTDLSSEIVKATGFPREKITVFQNTIDTAELQGVLNMLTVHELEKLRDSLFHNDSARQVTGVFCARLVPLKWIPFLLETLDIIYRGFTGFRMVIIGDGPEAKNVNDYCASRPWCSWVGAKHGVSRVPYLKLGDVYLNPGAIGLNIVDSLTIGIPMITTDNGIHGPEIAYLANGSNGLLLPPDPRLYAEKVIELISDETKLSQMKNNALRDGKGYTIDAMVDRFKNGVLQSLQN